MKRAVIAACVSGLLIASLISAQSPPGGTPASPVSRPSVLDWSSDLIAAVGVGQPPSNPVNVAQARAMAIRSALIDAERNLTSLTYGVVVQGEVTVGSLVASNEVIRARVENALKGARHVGQPNYQQDGSVELTVVMKRSDLANALLPEAGFSPAMPPPGPVPGPYTGLVVDVRGLNLTPALAPRVIDDRGQEVYGASFVTRDWAARKGVVGYAKDPEVARRSERVGPNPLFLRAAGATGPNRTDAALSAEDAAKVRGAAQPPGFLNQGRVVLVID